MSINLTKLKTLLEGSQIEVFEIVHHAKASEIYVDVRYSNHGWEGYIPFHYRRTALFIETEVDLAKYLKAIESNFSKKEIEKWAKAEKAWWDKEMKGRDVTKPFFDELVKMKWTNNFPPNNNPQRRIQDIKELGYTIASKRVGKSTFRLLLPLSRTAETGYEIFSMAFKKRAIAALKQLNAYELGSGNSKALILDHKFPEIRWDAETRAENPNNMPEEEIRKKFQLLDNQRNQQKREVCRRCFRIGKRGILFGIEYFYEGDENWPANVPKAWDSSRKRLCLVRLVRH